MAYEYLIEKSKQDRAEQDAVVRILQPYHLRPGDWQIIGAAHEGNQTITSIARRLDVSLAYVSVTVKELSKTEWLKLTTSEESDHRFRHVTFVGDEALFNTLEERLEKVNAHRD